MQFRGYKTSQKIEQIVCRARQSIDVQRHFEGGDFQHPLKARPIAHSQHWPGNPTTDKV